MRTIELSLMQAGGMPTKLASTIEIPESLAILDDPKALPNKGHGVMRIMTPKDGDKRVVWDSNSADEIWDAKAFFDKLIQEGLVPYRVGTNGKATSEVMDEFDPYAEEVVFLPVAMVTGG